jgi:DHA3 family macrolide efflux protein-like MFS transporter
MKGNIRLTRDTLLIFRNRNFTKLFLAALLSKFGTVIGMTAFLFYLLRQFATQPQYASLSQMVMTLPTLALFILVGVVADRFDRQRIMVWSDWIRTALTLFLLVAAIEQSVTWMFIALFIRSAVGNFFDPAESGLMQGILSPDEYTLSAGLQQTQMSLFMLFGTALGAFFYGTLGIEGAIAVDAASYAASAVLVSTCRITDSARLPSGAAARMRLGWTSIARDFADGLRYVVQHKLLLNVILGFFILGIVNGGFMVIPLYMLRYRLSPHHYEAMYALNGVLSGSALLVASMMVPWVTKRMALHWMFILGFFVGGALIVAEAFSPNVGVFLGIDVLFSLSVPFVNVPFGGWLPQLVAPDKMGRVDALIAPVVSVSSAATLGVIAFVFPRFVTVADLFYLVGGSILLVSIYYAAVLPPLVRRQPHSVDPTAQTPLEM